MFGFSKPKEIDPALLQQNVVNTILNIWSDPQSLKYEKFDAFVEYAEMMHLGRPKSAVFFREKLRFITSVALTLLSKSGIDENSIKAIVNEVKSEADKVVALEANGATTALGTQAEEYAKYRSSTNAKDAGHHVEDKFSQEAFGFVPSDDDVNRRYTLYKSLSSFERSTIFEIASAIRKSQV